MLKIRIEMVIFPQFEKCVVTERGNYNTIELSAAFPLCIH
jgi:hypothetical protein